MQPEDRKYLSKRELQVLAYFAAGKTCRETAELLFISIDTVRTHRTHILKVLSALNIAHAVYIAIQMGLIKI